jgi:hypothetical protein
MAILVEGFSVIVRKEALERNFPSGLDAYQRQRPNETYCYNDKLCRVGFMTQDEAMAHARRLAISFRATGWNCKSGGGRATGNGLV